MMTKVVILNGAPSSGKDTVAQWLDEVKYNGYSVYKQEFKEKLYDILGAIYSLPLHEVYSLSDRESKELPQECFGGLSLRQAMIKVSENIIKPNYGEDYFGIMAAKALIEGELNVFSDGGFQSELAPIIDKVGEDNVLIIRIHRDGCTFENDSRDFLPDGLVDLTVDIDNNGTLDELFENVEKAIKIFVGGEYEE
jgi:hypothetical protein